MSHDTQQAGITALNRWAPATEADRQHVREELERILSTPAFTASRHYPSFLRFIVERALEGRASELKERLIGADVFGRDLAYDTNLDPVVRTTASEVRKRLAHYYLDPHRQSAVRIELPTGTYIPEFHQLKQRPPASLAQTRVEPGRRSKRWFLLALMPLAALAVWRPWVEPSVFDEFWTPVLRSRNPVLIAFGNSPNLERLETQARAAAPPKRLTVNETQRLNTSPYGDALVFGRFVKLLAEKGKTFEVRRPADATLNDLTTRPSLLIGGFNNQWTVRLNETMRFTFAGESETIRCIKDRKDPSRRDWKVDDAMPMDDLKRDFGLVSRVLDERTGQYVLIVGGLKTFGTLAGGVFLTEPSHMEGLRRVAPKGWEQKNVQVVLATDVIDGNAGPPKILAAEFW